MPRVRDLEKILGYYMPDDIIAWHIWHVEDVDALVLPRELTRGEKEDAIERVHDGKVTWDGLKKAAHNVIEEAELRFKLDVFPAEQE